MLVTGRGLLPGQALVVGSVEPPAATTAERFADAVRVSWEWPPDVQIVEVRWHDGAQERVRRVSRARYQADGGVRLSHGAHVERVRVASVMRLDDEDWVSAPALVSLPSKHKTRMTYTLTQRRSLLGRRSCLVTAQSPTALVAEVKLVLHRGSYMPGPHDGQEIDRFVLDLAPDQPGEHVVDVPKTSSPYWLRLFLTDTDAAIELVDPLNTSQLKG